MVTTATSEHAALIRTLRDHGASRSDLERHQQQQHSFLLAEYRHLGFNYRMTDIQGALGTTQLAKAARIMTGRRSAAAWYDELLANVEWLKRPYRDVRVRHGEQSYVCLFQPEVPSLENCARIFAQRNDGMAALERRGIITRQGTHAPAHVPYYAEKYGIQPGDYPNGWLAERCTISLPLYAGMTQDECALVVSALHDVYAGVAA